MKKLWQLCACAAGVLAGLWRTARILLPGGLPFLLGLGLARLARPLAARLRRLPLPETMTAAGAVRVTDAEIDDNGHMNNVAYVRRAQEAAPGLFRGLEVVYDRECFRGALLTLEHAAGADAQYVRGVLESGEESFRMRFFGAEAAQ